MKKHFLIFTLLVALAVSVAACGGADIGPGMAHADDPSSETDRLILPEIKNDAITAGNTAAKKAVVAVDAGYASNGSSISLPSGFTASQCKFTASVATVDSSTISTRVAVASSGDDVGLVTCLRTVQEREEIPATTQGCVASYTMLCTKEVDQ